ncbi:MAG: VWA domain-containing protein [Ilumatobacteraceae bacterium]
MSILRGRVRRRRGGRDAGMTLPEVLISIVILGTLMTAMVGATTVILRQQDNSVGRLNNSRSEQNVGIWLPSDLASAELVRPEAERKPCADSVPDLTDPLKPPLVIPGPCPAGINVGGSNALMLSWTGTVAGSTDAIPTRTTVSYRYVEVDGEFQIIRVKCLSVAGAAPTCDQVIVMHDATPPPPGQTWTPGVTSPFWMFVVRLALDPALIDEPTDTAPVDPTYYTKNGRRVTVTINGGGDAAGAGGGLDNVTLSAGGTDRKPDLSTSNPSVAPTFGATRSRCGGNFAMLVDTSGSIGSTNMASVRTGITAFINSFAGTPIKLEIVKFSNTATTLGAGAGWSRYYDMLVESDVADLNAQVATLSSNGFTNWEDAMFRVFKNNDGSVQPTLPDTLIFFTDGMPTSNRLVSSSSTYPAAADNDDAGLPAAGGGSYNQVSWNRAWRIARDYYADVDRFIGVFVGADTTGTSLWRQQGAGYHYENFIRGYHQSWDRGYHLENFLRGYHQTWDRGYHYENLQRGYHLEYQRATVTTTGNVTYQKKSSGNWNNVNWDTGSTSSQYARNNSNNTESDNYRVVISGTPTTWVKMNTVNGKAPLQLYNESNKDSGETDGFRIAKVYTSPFDAYEATDAATFATGNPSLPTINAGWTATQSFTAPFTYWTSTTQALYNAGNVASANPADSDGWRANNLYSSPYTSWEATTEALYNTNNTTTDNTDGWTGSTAYTAPFTLWSATTQALYNSSNTTPDALDGWRENYLYSSPYTGWETATEALYTANNTATGTADGWDATKVYAQPYTFHENATSYNRPNKDILGQIVSEGATVPAVPTGGPYTNAAVADLYVLPNWDQFAGALNAMALAECGGTVTVQTKVGTASAADPFTYLDSTSRTTATTSSLYRSGTFDFDLSGGLSVTTDITPQDASGLERYEHVSWSCKSAGADYPFTVSQVLDEFNVPSPWPKITLTVAPNQAISCTQTVRLK